MKDTGCWVCRALVWRTQGLAWGAAWYVTVGSLAASSLPLWWFENITTELAPELSLPARNTQQQMAGGVQAGREAPYSWFHWCGSVLSAVRECNGCNLRHSRPWKKGLQTRLSH